MLEGLWDVDDVAVYLKRSRRWVRGEIAAGRIPCVRLRRAPRFDPATVRDWVLVGCPPVATFNEWQRIAGKKLTRVPGKNTIPATSAA